jgi:hypothetical protein
MVSYRRAVVVGMFALWPVVDAPRGLAADTAPASGDPVACRVTATVRKHPPQDLRASDFGHGPWHVNSERTVWAKPWHPWTTRAKGIKVFWVRPAGAQLHISGRRLDGEAPPLAARIPCCYPWGFQSTRLFFPAPGCWEVTGTAGSESATFTVAVAPAAPADEAKDDRSGAPDQRRPGGALERPAGPAAPLVLPTERTGSAAARSAARRSTKKAL